MPDSQTDIHLIKKYPNRRLYDTHISSYVTLTDIRQLVIDEIEFQIVDAKTGEDLTRKVLLQIIQEAESDGEPIFSSDVLKGAIRFYGPMQGLFGSYLEKSIQTIVEMQSQAGAQSAKNWNDYLQKQTPAMQEWMQHSTSLYHNVQHFFDLFSGKRAETPGSKKDDEDKNGDKP